MEQINSKYKWFRFFSRASLVMVFLLILVGGTVRVTGSGMGCPDWPTCFGKIVPPTSESELPANYQEIYASHGYANEKFNAFKTWTEYINRLFGVLTGFTVFGLFLSSLAYRKTFKLYILLSFAIVFLTGFEGWLGALVVDSNLDNAKITTHLLVAFLIIGLIVFLNIHNTQAKLLKISNIKFNRELMWFSLILALLTIQIVLGAGTRTEIDHISAGIDNRAEWINYAESYFPVHRFFTWLLVIVSVAALWQTRNWLRENAAATLAVFLYITATVAQAITGIILSYAAYPALGQFLHLMFATVMLVALFMLISMVMVLPQTVERVQIKDIYLA